MKTKFKELLSVFLTFNNHEKYFVGIVNVVLKENPFVKLYRHYLNKLMKFKIFKYQNHTRDDLPISVSRYINNLKKKDMEIFIFTHVVLNLLPK